MKFRYIFDSLFVACLVIYGVNRFVVKPYFPNEFSGSYMNDLICIPFWLPIMLLVMRLLRLRPNDYPPQPWEVVICLLVWSFIFEIWIPQTDMFRSIAFADYMDILYYNLGGLGALMFWHRERLRSLLFDGGVESAQ